MSDDSFNSYIVFNAYGGIPKNPELSRVMSSVKTTFIEIIARTNLRIFVGEKTSDRHVKYILKIL